MRAARPKPFGVFRYRLFRLHLHQKLQFYVELATRFVRYRATFSNIGNHNYEF